MSYKPTSSTQINAILEEVHQWLSSPSEDAEKISPLVGRVKERIEGFPAARQDFWNTAEGRGKEFLENAEEQLQECARLFEAHEDSMVNLYQSLEKMSAQEVQTAVEEMERTAHELLHQLNVYTAFVMSQGESKFSLVNFVKNLASGVKRGDIEKEEMSQALETLKTFYQQAQRDVEGSTLEAEDKEQEMMAFKATEKALEHVEESLSGEAGEAVSADDALRELQFSMEKILRAKESTFESNFLEGPTELPAANLVIQTIVRGRGGILPQDLIRETLRSYDDFLEEFSYEFSEVLREENDLQGAVAEELPKTMLLMEDHGEVWENLKELVLESASEEKIDEAIEEWKENITELHRSTLVYAKAMESHGKVVCVHCGFQNTIQDSCCAQCSAPVPKMFREDLLSQSSFEIKEQTGEEGDEETVVTENMVRIFQACQAYYDKDITTEEFLVHLNWLGDIVESAQDKNEKVTSDYMTPGELEDFEEQHPGSIEDYKANRDEIEGTIGLMELGCEELLSGLSLLYDYAEMEEPPRSLIERGVELLWHGFEKVNQVIAAGQEADKRLQEIEAEEVAAASAGGGAPPPA